MVQRGLRGGAAVRIAMQTQAQVDAKAAMQAREAERAAILAELDALDKRSAHALRAVVAGTATDEDRAALAKIEDEAIALRARLAGLGK